MAKDRRPGIKDDATYEALRAEGASKEKAARIANTENAGRKGGKAPPYEEWTLEKLKARARDIGIAGRSYMNKAELIDALRNH